MVKKLSKSSRPAGLTRMKCDDIKNRKWTEAEQQSFRQQVVQQAAGDDTDIRFDDIPALTDQQLAQMVRLRDLRPKVSVNLMEAEQRLPSKR